MLCLDIGSNSIKLCELADSGVGWQAKLIAHASLPDGLVREGGVADSAALHEVLTGLVDRHDLRTRRVAVAISSPSALALHLELPVMSDAELSEAIVWEAEQHARVDLGAAYLGWRVLRRASDMMIVELGLEHREVIDPILAVVRRARLVPEQVSVTELALFAWFCAQHRRHARAVLVDIGAAATVVLSVGEQRLAHSRRCEHGGELLTRALQRRLQTTRDAAERLKLDAYTPQPIEAASPYRESDANAMVRSVLSEASDELAAKLAPPVRAALTRGGEPPACIWISGGSSTIPELARALQRELALPAEQWLPYGGLRTSDAGAATTLVRVGPQLAVVFGLAAGVSGLAIPGLTRPRWWQLWKR